MLTSVTGVGVATTFGYDLNGNTLFKWRVTEGAVTISYRNLSGEDRTYTFNGQDIVFPPTGWEYQTITFGAVVGSKVSLKSSDLDANPSLTISIDYVHIVTSQNDVMLYSYNASYGGSVFLEEDWEAVSDWALVGFGMTGDWMEWSAGLPESEEVNYTWDALVRNFSRTKSRAKLQPVPQRSRKRLAQSARFPAQNRAAFAHCRVVDASVPSLRE